MTEAACRGASVPHHSIPSACASRCTASRVARRSPLSTRLRTALWIPARREGPGAAERVLLSRRDG